MTFEERKYVKKHLSRFEVLPEYGFKFKMFGAWFLLVDKDIYEIEPCDEPIVEYKKSDDDLPF